MTREKRIWLAFDGVFRDATVWVNGWCVRRHEGGYYPFGEDITDVLHFGGTNTISVRVDATKSEGWFYEGQVFTAMCGWIRQRRWPSRRTACLLVPNSRMMCRRTRWPYTWGPICSTHSPTPP